MNRVQQRWGLLLLNWPEPPELAVPSVAMNGNDPRGKRTGEGDILRMGQVNAEALGTKDIVWKLGDLYSGTDDPAAAIDIEQCREKAESLSQQYSQKVAKLNDDQMLLLVTQLEAVDTLVAKLATFAYLYFSTQTGSGEASAFLQRVEELSAEVGRLTVFFRLEINDLTEGEANRLLAAPALTPYKHYLQSLRRFAPHQLSGKEEELLQDFAPVGRNAWNVLFDKLMGRLRFGESGRTEEEVLSDLYHGERQVRKQAAQEMTDALGSNMHLLAHIFNTLASEKMISDRVRRYDSWSSAINLSNELEAQTVDTLINAVTGRYDLVHRYYQYKKELLGYDELFDYDRYAPVLSDTEDPIPWEHCRQIVVDAFSGFSPRMGDIADRFFTNQWIHAPIIEGKRGGAYAHPCVPEVHPYVMVNYAGTMRDVSTVAHELGHGVHQFLAAEKGFYNSDTPLVLAETASVFAEFIVFNAQLNLLKDKNQRRGFLCQKIESIFATVFRQVAMNRFEHHMHIKRREKGELAEEEFNSIWLDTQQAMFGDSVTLTTNYASWWSYIPHFLSTPGYVYSYAFGELLVLALYSLYQQEGSAFVDKYQTLLKAGGSKSPYELLEPFEIDLNAASFWEGGLDTIESLLNRLD
jgi:oligoendopeptidase F